MPFLLFAALAIPIIGASLYGTFRLEQRMHATALAVLGGAAVTLLNAYHAHLYTDDAYITLRYSRNLSDGIGPVWNPGERVEGYTNFLWMLILAGMHRAGFELVAASHVLAVIALLATVLVTWRLWTLWSRDDDAGIIAHPAVLVVALCGIGLNGSVATWAFSGLETPLAMALLTTGVFLFIVEQRTGSFPWSALAFSAGAMTRPELAGIAVFTGAYGFGDALLRGDRAALRRMTIWTALFAATYGPYFAWRWSYYGYLLPNTFYVKVASNRETILNGLEYVRTHGQGLGFLPLIVGAFLLTFQRSTGIKRDAVYILAVIVAWLTIVAVEGGDAFSAGRFLAPIVPIITLAGVAGLAALLRRGIADRRQFAAVSAAAVVIFALALAQSSVDGRRKGFEEVLETGERGGRLLDERAPDHYTVAVIAAGTVPYFSGMPSLDMLGLNDEVIAHTDVAYAGQGVQAHEKYNIDYVLMEARPEIIAIVGFSAEPRSRAVFESLTLISPLRIEAIYRLVTDPRTWELYQISSIRSGDGWYNYLQRKDTLAEFPPDATEEPAPTLAR